MTENTKTYTLDASGQTLGRLSSKIAAILLGKNTTTAARNTVVDCEIVVENASKIKVTGDRCILVRTVSIASGVLRTSRGTRISSKICSCSDRNLMRFELTHRWSAKYASIIGTQKGEMSIRNVKFLSVCPGAMIRNAKFAARKV
jgi:hypothetical protein